MKTTLPFLAALVLLMAPARAAITVPGANNTDGELVVTANTVIDLSQAVDAAWDSDNTANAGKGVYDKSKWAVVFKYSRVTVNAGATVTFKNHPSRAPVVWLVDGDVLIAGVVSLNGQNSVPAPGHAEPGPGGFRGGRGYYSGGVGSGAGFGVGGGPLGNNGPSGSYGTLAQSTYRDPVYGNPSLVPLIGGSGGAGHHDAHPAGGGAGGGAILIAAAGEISVSGRLDANGGNYSSPAGGGSGGGIRLVCDRLAGSGNIRALGGSGNNGSGGLGRIRIERVSVSGSPVVTPDPSLVPLTSGAQALLWPPDDGPAVRILTVGGAPVSDDPRASFGVLGPDVALPQTDSVQVVIETVNVEAASQVQVRLTPGGQTERQVVNATLDPAFVPVGGILRWLANVPVRVGYSAMQVKVVRP